MPTLRERVLGLLVEHGPMTDAQLRQAADARSHQHVNQVCRRMAENGEIDRRRGNDGLIRNVRLPAGEHPVAVPTARSSRAGRPSQLDTRVETLVPRLDDPGVLVVLPCSARKVDTARPAGDVVGITDGLPAALADELLRARSRVVSVAELQREPVAAALDRYDGSFYRQLDRDRLRAADCPVVILSGGYGLLDTDEPIGNYNRELRRSDWPDGLLGRALVATAAARQVHTVIGLLASTTDYAKVFRAAPWEQTGARVLLVTVAGGGSTGGTPTALGQALMAALDAPLDVSLLHRTDSLQLAIESVHRSRQVSPERIRDAVQGLTDKARRHRPGELDPTDPIWGRPGLYAWSMDDTARAVLADALQVDELPQVVYAGQAGATSWPSGRRSMTTLGKRIRGNHLRGNMAASTFRRTLAAVLLSAEGQQIDEAELSRLPRRRHNWSGGPGSGTSPRGSRDEGQPRRVEKGDGSRNDVARDLLAGCPYAPY